MRLASIEGAIRFAVDAHDGQLDKAGMPYILHPLRVGAALHEFPEPYVIAGILHDVLEDTDYTAADLIAYGASVDVVEAVLAVTKSRTEVAWDAYRVALDRATADPIGGWVKASDVADNYARLGSVADPLERTRLTVKYEQAIPYLAERGFDPARFL